MIDVFCQPDDLVSHEDLDHIAARVASIAEAVEREEAVTLDTVAIVLVTSDRISELHRTFFDDPSTTDVITFPDEPGISDALSGEIAICVDVAREQSDLAGHAWTEEVVFLAVHGLLHLSGWDDALPADRRRMLERQRELIESTRQASEPLT